MDERQPVAERGYSESRIRVRYAETDQMGVVYHANYLIWFEVGRVDFMRQLGLDYRSLEREESAFIPVVEVTARYKSPARYDDELVVRTTFGGARGSIIRFRYAITRPADGTLLCEGESVHVVVGPDMKKRDLPAGYAEQFAALGHHLQKPGEGAKK